MYFINSLLHKAEVASSIRGFSCLSNDSLSCGLSQYDPSCKKNVEHKQNKTASMQNTLSDSISWIKGKSTCHSSFQPVVTKLVCSA